MNHELPLISILLPVYNAEKYLSASLDSLLQQTYSNLEIIAIDDFSTDTSYEILSTYAQKDTRLHISRNVKHYGMAMTLNRCTKQSQGVYIAVANPKDKSHCTRFMEQYRYLQTNEKTVAVGVQCRFFNEEEQEIGRSEFPTTEHADMYKKPLDGVTMLFESMLIHRHRIPKDVLHFKTNKYPFIYTDIVIKLIKYGTVVNLPQMLYTKRLVEQHKPQTMHLPSLAKIWLRAMTVYDHKLPLRSLFLSPLLASLK